MNIDTAADNGRLGYSYDQQKCLGGTSSENLAIEKQTLCRKKGEKEIDWTEF